MSPMKGKEKWKPSGLCSKFIINDQDIFSTFSIKERQYRASFMTGVCEKVLPTVISSQNGKNRVTKIFAVFAVFKLEIPILAQHAFAEYLNQSLKKGKLSNVFTAVVEDAA